MAKERQTERRRLEDEQKRNARKEVFSWVRMFVTVIVVVFVLTHFIIINAKVPSGSMENTIMTHDRSLDSGLHTGLTNHNVEILFCSSIRWMKNKLILSV